jgi:transcriptional regulator with XRE-family HTH domain
MSPAAEFLENLRMRRKLSQVAFSRLTSLQTSYLSGIARGKQHIPRHSKFIEQIAGGLALKESQIARLRTAIDSSPRDLAIPPNAHRDVFMMMAALRDHMADIDSELAIQIRKKILSHRTIA